MINSGDLLIIGADASVFSVWNDWTPSYAKGYLKPGSIIMVIDWYPTSGDAQVAYAKVLTAHGSGWVRKAAIVQVPL